MKRVGIERYGWGVGNMDGVADIDRSGDGQYRSGRVEGMGKGEGLEIVRGGTIPFTMAG